MRLTHSVRAVIAPAALAPLLLALAGLAGSKSARAEVCNLKVVTDANPDYTDIGSMIHSITCQLARDAKTSAGRSGTGTTSPAARPRR